MDGSGLDQAGQAGVGQRLAPRPIRPGFNSFVYVLEGEATFGANRRPASRSQIAVLGQGGALTVEEAHPETRFVVMAGKPYGETPVFNGPFVD